MKGDYVTPVGSQAMTAPIRCWHFASDELRDGRPLPKKGDTLKHEGEVVPCSAGLHGSVRALDALRYAQGFNVARTELRGNIVPHEQDKHAASERHYLTDYVDAKAVIIKWARNEADIAVRVTAVAALRSAASADGMKDEHRTVLRKHADDLETLPVIESRAAARAARDAAGAARDAAWAAGAARDAAWAAGAASDAAGAACDAAWAACDAAWAARDAAGAAWAAWAAWEACDAARAASAAAWAAGAARDAARAASDAARAASAAAGAASAAARAARAAARAARAASAAAEAASAAAANERLEAVLTKLTEATC